MIRAGTEQDIAAIIRMAREFWKNTAFDEVYEPEMVACMAQACIDQGLMSVYEHDGAVRGFACGICGPLLASSEVLAGTEMAWWVDEDARGGTAGVKLLRHLEGLAKNVGVKYWTMVFMESSMPETVASIYKKMGYKKTETSYMRVL
jgi:GNAT superfamily N-acetyltransferase